MTLLSAIGIQARMSSSRLPGKVLMDLDGITMIDRVVSALAYAGSPVFVLTSTDPSDDVIVEHCRKRFIRVDRGPLDDVLGRYMKTLVPHWDFVARVCADAPFIEAGCVRGAVELCKATGRPVWVDNVCHVGTRDHWEKCSFDVPKDALDREHAGNAWFWTHGIRVSQATPPDYLMVNTPEDLAEARRRLTVRGA